MQVRKICRRELQDKTRSQSLSGEVVQCALAEIRSRSITGILASLHLRRGNEVLRIYVQPHAAVFRDAMDLDIKFTVI